MFQTDIKRDLGEVLIDIGLSVGSIVLRGIVLSYLWAWFVVPFGIAPITVLHALGISTMVAFLTFNIHVKNDLHPKPTRVVLSILWPLLVFVFGYIYHFGV